jgi:hypothetical protein
MSIYSIWWDEHWHRNQKYWEKICPSAELSTTSFVCCVLFERCVIFCEISVFLCVVSYCSTTATGWNIFAVQLNDNNNNNKSNMSWLGIELDPLQNRQVTVWTIGTGLRKTQQQFYVFLSQNIIHIAGKPEPRINKKRAQEISGRTVTDLTPSVSLRYKCIRFRRRQILCPTYSCFMHRTEHASWEYRFLLPVQEEMLFGIPYQTLTNWLQVTVALNVSTQSTIHCGTH